jgi:hypothetical protein
VSIIRSEYATGVAMAECSTKRCYWCDGLMAGFKKLWYRDEVYHASCYFYMMEEMQNEVDEIS